MPWCRGFLQSLLVARFVWRCAWRRLLLWLCYSCKSAPQQATIFQPAQSAMSSGKADTKYWTIEFEHTGASAGVASGCVQPVCLVSLSVAFHDGSRPPSDKWSSPFMGYLSAADPLKRLQDHMRFDSAQQAVIFAKRSGANVLACSAVLVASGHSPPAFAGWSYEVVSTPPSIPAQKNYSFNFLPQRIERRIANLGPRGARKVFKKTTANASQWVNHRHTDYGEHKWRSKQAASSE